MQPDRFTGAGILDKVKTQTQEAARGVLLAMDRRFKMDNLQKAYRLLQTNAWAEYLQASSSKRADLRAALRADLAVLAVFYGSPVMGAPALVEEIDLDMQWESLEVMMEGSTGKILLLSE